MLKANSKQRFELADGPFKVIRATDDQGRCDLITNPDTFKQFTPQFS